MRNKLTFNHEVHVISEDKLIYKITGITELGSQSLCMEVHMELVAGHDYVNPDESNQQGYVSKENFVENVQWESFTWLPMDETIESRLADEDYKVIDISKYKIHDSSLKEK